MRIFQGQRSHGNGHPDSNCRIFYRFDPGIEQIFLTVVAAFVTAFVFVFHFLNDR
jgi:hypothetical protein